MKYLVNVKLFSSTYNFSIDIFLDNCQKIEAINLISSIKLYKLIKKRNALYQIQAY